jgi:uncharacterized RDD family membrane protein YckC
MPDESTSSNPEVTPAQSDNPTPETNAPEQESKPDLGEAEQIPVTNPESTPESKSVEATPVTPVTQASSEVVTGQAENKAPASNETFEFAGIGSRFFASIVDGFLLGITTFAINVAFVSSIEPSAEGTSLALAQLINFALYLGYYTYFIGNSGQTIGKKMLAIKVVTTHGEQPSYATALIRYIVSFVSGIIFALGYIWAFFNKEKQTWHDKAAGTYVVKA